MSDAPSPPRSSRDELRQRFLGHAAAAFDLLFAPQYQDQLVTFDQKLRLGTEGYSPTVLRKAVRQAAKASSFRDASDDLKELAGVAICPTHLGKLAERVGREWADRRDADVEAFRADALTTECA